MDYEPFVQKRFKNGFDPVTWWFDFAFTFPVILEHRSLIAKLFLTIK